MQEHNRGAIEMEKTREVIGMYVARLKDLGLGNPEGIPSTYREHSDEQLNAIAEQDARDLLEPTDLSVCGCIDGRCTLGNADGSDAEIRLRRVGGSASDLGIALNADASITEAFDSEASLEDHLKIIEQLMGPPSAHEGGCGGANGEVGDNEAIHTQPEIMDAVKTFMQIPYVRDYLEVDFDERLANKVRENAGKTAAFLRSKGWVGQDYVERAKRINPSGVEVLEVDESDAKFHGHKEKSLKIVIGDKTVDQDDEFVWNLKATKQVAEKLAGQRGVEGYTQALIADIAKHMKVADRLPSDETPIMLLVA